MNDKMDLLKTIIKSYAQVMVAFSGGVDSAFLLKICVDVLGEKNVYAVTGASETYTPEELDFAVKTAAELNVRHIIIRTDEISDENFVSNTELRCYHCKKQFYAKLQEKADSENIQYILDGTNQDDANDYRPGRKAAYESGILSPLLEAGLTKNEIRVHSKAIGLSSWDKPANPCLASRVPYGMRITRDKLETIASAEKFLHSLKFENIRVRHHESIARIEISIKDMPRFIENGIREKINLYMKSLGFTWAALDIGGYRTGSMNEAITAESGRIIKEDNR